MRVSGCQGAILALLLALSSCAAPLAPRSSVDPNPVRHRGVATRVTAPVLRAPSPQAYTEFLLAELAVAQGDRDAARRRFRRALVEDPESPELRLRLAELALQEGETRKALSWVEEATRVDPSYPRAQLLGAQLLREQDPPRARALLWRVISLWPRDPSAYLWLAPLERRHRGVDVERRIYQALLSHHPDHLEGHLGLARALDRLGQVDQAARLLERACQAHPFAVEPWIRLGRLRIGQGHWAQAARSLYQGLEATGDDPVLAEEIFRLWLARGRPERARDLVDLLEGHETAAALTQVANLRDRLGDETGAERALFQARKQDPAFGPALAEQARQLRRRGQDAAIERLLEGLPSGTEVWAAGQLERAAQWEAAGERETAEGVLLGILHARPRDAVALESLAFLQARRGKLTLAKASLDRARRERGLLGEDAGHRYALALLYEEAGQWAQAERLARAQLAGDPDDSGMLNLLGFGLADRGLDLRRALALLLRAQRLDPLNPYVLDSLGWALVQRGRPGAALPWLERAIAVDRRLCEAWIHLAEARRSAGLPREARAAREAALGCRPTKSLQAVLRGRLSGAGGRPGTPHEPWAPRARTRSDP